MSDALRPVLGLYRLLMHINRTFWAMNVFMALILPLIVQAAFASQLGRPARTRLLICNVLLGLAMVTFRKVGLTLTLDRVFGYRDLLATGGVTRNVYLAAYALDAFTLALLPLGVAVVAVAALQVPAPASWDWLGAYALSAVVLFALGVWFARRAKSLPPVVLTVNLAVMGAMAFCPIAYPPERAPALIRPIVSLLPPSLSAETMAAGWAGEPLPTGPLALLAGWTLLFALLAWRQFPWTDRA